MDINQVKQIMLKSDFNLLERALDDYDINEFDKFGNNVLHFYIKERKRINLDCKSVIDLFLNKGLYINGKKDNKYVFGSPLQLAVSMKQKDVFDYLIELGANVNATDSNGNSILSTAVMWYRDTEMDEYFIKRLLECGANIDQTNHYGISPKSLAESIANYNVKKYFQK